jgi:hypothetical protein
MTNISCRLQQVCLLFTTTNLFLPLLPVASHDQQMTLEQRLSSSFTVREVHEETMSSSPQEYQHYYDFKTMLPRVEVQLLCSHDVPSDFDVTDTFRKFYQEFFLAALSHDEDSEQLQSNIVRTGTVDVVDQVDDDASPFEMELFTLVSRSNVDDVKPHDDFYDLCDPTSTTVLLTMDVRGYIRLRTNHDIPTNVHLDGPLDGFRTHDNLQRLMDQVNPSAIKDYFAQHVCSPFQVDENEYQNNISRSKHGQADMDPTSTSAVVDNKDAFTAMEYFKAKVKPWDTLLAPPPPSSSHDYPYPSTQDHRHFDHNLRLLCDGGVDAVYPNYHKQAYRGPDNITSLVIGVLVGMVMVGMILKELKQKRHSSIRDRRRRQEEQNTSVAWPTTTAVESHVHSSNPRVMGYETMTQDETQSV